MKSFNSKAQEQKIINDITKQMRKAMKKFIGKYSQKEIEEVNLQAQKVLENLWSKTVIYCPPKPVEYVVLDFTIEPRCLICGANCPEGDCQLGVE